MGVTYFPSPNASKRYFLSYLHQSHTVFFIALIQSPCFIALNQSSEIIALKQSPFFIALKQNSVFIELS